MDHQDETGVLLTPLSKWLSVFDYALLGMPSDTEARAVRINEQGIGKFSAGKWLSYAWDEIAGVSVVDGNLQFEPTNSGSGRDTMIVAPERYNRNLNDVIDILISYAPRDLQREWARRASAAS